MLLNAWGQQFNAHKSTSKFVYVHAHKGRACFYMYCVHAHAHSEKSNLTHGTGPLNSLCNSQALLNLLNTKSDYGQKKEVFFGMQVYVTNVGEFMGSKSGCGMQQYLPLLTLLSFDSWIAVKAKNSEIDMLIVVLFRRLT